MNTETTKDEASSILEELDAWHKQTKTSYSKIGALLGVEATTVHRWVTGKRKPSKHYLTLIRSLLAGAKEHPTCAPRPELRIEELSQDPMSPKRMALLVTKHNLLVCALEELQGVMGGGFLRVDKNGQEMADTINHTIDSVSENNKEIAIVARLTNKAIDKANAALGECVQLKKSMSFLHWMFIAMLITSIITNIILMLDVSR